MPTPASGKSQLSTNALSTAFEALKTYDSGSGRATLLPIDEAVVASLDDKSKRRQLEARLVSALKNGGSVAAHEYVCSKLALIGTDRCVSVVGRLLTTPELATAARNALENIPGRRAAQALRQGLTRTEGVQKIGVINSLGARRDAGSVRALSVLLKDEGGTMAGAAAAALGDIATARSGKALLECLPMAPRALQAQAADACMVCAEQWLVTGRRADAEALYQTLTTTTLPKHIQNAAVRRLELITGQK